jgi:hypothetical protein
MLRDSHHLDKNATEEERANLGKKEEEASLTSQTPYTQCNVSKSNPQAIT